MLLLLQLVQLVQLEQAHGVPPRHGLIKPTTKGKHYAACFITGCAA
jgi:hypothetical protein